jgi:hypothetical protein
LQFICGWNQSPADATRACFISFSSVRKAGIIVSQDFPPMAPLFQPYRLQKFKPAHVFAVTYTKVSGSALIGWLESHAFL